MGLVCIWGAWRSYAADIFRQVESWVPGFYFGQRGGMRATNALLGRSVWKGREISSLSFATLFANSFLRT